MITKEEYKDFWGGKYEKCHIKYNTLFKELVYNLYISLDYRILYINNGELFIESCEDININKIKHSDYIRLKNFNGVEFLEKIQHNMRDDTIIKYISVLNHVLKMSNIEEFYSIKFSNNIDTYEDVIYFISLISKFYIDRYNVYNPRIDWSNFKKLPVNDCGKIPWVVYDDFDFLSTREEKRLLIEKDDEIF
jgi:hypothetical protein